MVTRLPATSLRRKNAARSPRFWWHPPRGSRQIHRMQLAKMTCIGKRWETLGNSVEICWNMLKYPWNIPEISLKYPWNIPESSHESSHESSWMNLVMNVTKTFPKSCCSWFAWFHLPLFGSMFHIFCLVSSCLASCCVDYLAAFRETSCLPLHYSF
jgi:hypothetical protein